ncbi:Spy/CpxP family protein refolding chaperone [Chryseobacterium terrae]|uniref:LTXXQ motif family protein n=1 Tax=Chryseobacterium terrae TaxID=3163299 RepID=A0ABW8Y5H6_9FLAO
MKKLVLAAAFIVTGSFAMAQQVNPQGKKINREEMHKKMEMKHQERMNEMQKELNLNESQVAKIKDLHEKRKAEMKAKRQQMDNDMKTILSPDQYDKWQASRKAKMEERKSAMKERRMKGDRKMMAKPQSGTSI